MSYPVARLIRVLAVCSVAAGCIVLSGCSGGGPKLPKLNDLNPFAKKQQPLPGRRVPVIQNTSSISDNLADASQPIHLPAPHMNDSWPQPGGNPKNAPGHLALNSSPSRSWSADAGEGSSKSARIMASPIVYGGRVYTLDSQGVLTGFATSGGKIFQVSTVPEGEDAGGHGGGLAAADGRLYVANGFGVAAALDPGSGKVIWQKNLGTPIRAAPTAANGKMFVASIDGRFYCLDGSTGDEVWRARGLPQPASLMNSTSPAVDGDIVVVPYPSGDVMALKISDGTLVWTESLARSRRLSQLASMSDAARPAIDRGMVFAVGHSGRMVATNSETGERLWSVDVPGIQTPYVAGDTVYVVDTNGRLLALTRTDGKTRWTVQLPDTKRWAGPVLAGGMLWLASNKGQLAGVDATTGKVVSKVDIGDAVYIPPVVAQGRMYVLTDSAKLVAFN